VGYCPIAPGTAGSIAGLAVHAALRATGAPSWLDAAAIVALFATGAWAASIAERHFGRDDPGPVVVDEVMGMLVSLAFVPVGAGGALAGFVLFRLFDVVKPWPAGRLEALPGGLGVMSDDAMAGIYANLALRLVLTVAPGAGLG
jgi:phosphatidylglycerophosphatase A